jgi:hypothetical protein
MKRETARKVALILTAIATRTAFDANDGPDQGPAALTDQELHLRGQRTF